MALREWIEQVGLIIDVVGVAVMVAGAIFAAGRLVLGRSDGGPSYRMFRQDLGRAILLGLEFLVAGDIIRTVAVDPSIENVAVLGIIVLIRTFLSMTLELELEGRWPWQRKEEPVYRAKAEAEALVPK